MAHLKFYIVTFNCGRAFIEPDVFGQHLLDAWDDPLPNKSAKPDVIVLNLQEIAPIGYAFLGGNFVQPYFDHFKKAVSITTAKASNSTDGESDSYINLFARHCGLTGLMVFAREDVADDLKSINVAEVGVGLSEMANKGAVGARVGWQRAGSDQATYTTFVSAHLAPFESEVQRRDQDYRDIVKGLQFTREDVRESRKDARGTDQVPLLAQETGSERASTERPGMYADDSYLFFSGDLNYRTAITKPNREDSQYFPQRVNDTKSEQHYLNLLEKDQLTQQLQEGKTLHGLAEQKIDFPPTYKLKTVQDKAVILDEDVSAWNWAEHRWPSWCDRILFSSTDKLKVSPGKYSALPIFRTSDHRPVALSIAVPFEPIHNSGFEKQAPVQIDPQARSRRASARQKELVVGLAAYLGLTWEGRSLVAGTLVFILGAIALYKSMN